MLLILTVTVPIAAVFHDGPFHPAQPKTPAGGNQSSGGSSAGGGNSGGSTDAPSSESPGPDTSTPDSPGSGGETAGGTGAGGDSKSPGGSTDGNGGEPADNGDEPADPDAPSKSGRKKNGPEPEEVAEIDQKTNQILAKIEAAKRIVNDADRAMRNATTAELFAKTMDMSSELTTPAKMYMAKGRSTNEAVLRSSSDQWDCQYAAAAHTRSELEKELGVSRSPQRGDPVRMTDGAYLATIPFPVFAHHGISVDLSLYYDSTRKARSSWGRGWSSLLDQRIVLGALKPPELTDTYTLAMGELTELTSKLTTLLARATPGRPGSIDEIISTVDELRDNYRRQGQQCRQSIEQIQSALSKAVEYGVPTHRLSSTMLEVKSLQDRTTERLDTLDSLRVFLGTWSQAADTLDDYTDHIQTLQNRLRLAEEEYRIAQNRNHAVLYPGSDPGTMEVGTDHCVFIDQFGTPHVFSKQSDQNQYRSTALPYHRLTAEKDGWTLTDENGRTRRFDQQGRLTAISGRTGDPIRIRRTGSGDISLVVEPGDDGSPGTVNLARISSTKTEASIALPAHQTVKVSLSTDGPTEIDNPRGRLSIQYKDGLLASVTRQDGSTTAVTYDRSSDEFPRTVSVRYPTGGIETFAYPSQSTRIYRDPDGLLTRYTLDGYRVTRVEKPSGHIITREYDQYGRLSRERDNRDHDVRLVYDAAGAVIQRQFTDGTWIRIDRHKTGAPVAFRSDRGEHWRAQRDTDGTVLSITTPEETLNFTDDGHNRDIRHVSSSRGGHWSTTYDLRGNPLLVRRGDGREETFSYDTFGRPVSHRINGLVVREITYDDGGRPVTIEEHDVCHTFERGGRVTVHKVDGTIIETTTTDRDGRVLECRYHDGSSETYSYTPGGLLQQHNRRDGTDHIYRYDSHGLLQDVRDHNNRIIESYRYDESGRVVARTVGSATFRTVYSGTGQFIGTIQPDGSSIIEHYLPGGRVRKVDPLGNTAMYRHDALGRVVRVLRDDDTDLRIDYTENETTHRLDGVVVFRERTDPYDRPVFREYQDGTNEQFSYETGPLPVTRRDRRGGTERWEWDRWGRCVSHEYADGRREWWRYHPDHVDYGDSDGRRVKRNFDPEGRLSGDFTGKKPDHWTGFTSVVTYAGDKNGTESWRAQLDPLGRIRELTTPNREKFHLSWDTEGRILSFQPPKGKARTYSYNRFGHLESRSDGESSLNINSFPVQRRLDITTTGHGRSITTGPYGRLERETSTTAGAEERHISISRDAAGRPVSIQGRPAGQRVDVRWFPEGRGFEADIGPYRAEVLSRPDHSAVLTFTLPSGRTWDVKLKTDQIIHDGEITIDIDPHGNRVFRRRRPSGFEEILDGLVYVRDGSTKIVTEQTLDGRLQAFGYDHAGRLEAVGRSFGSSSPSQTVVPDTPASQVDRTAIAQAWQNISSFIRIPSIPLRLYNHSIARDYAGHVITETTLKRDSLGRLTSYNDKTIAYHPITDRPFILAGPTGHWELEHRTDGAPWRYVNKTTGIRYDCIETTANIGTRQFVIRYWVRRTDGKRDEPDRSFQSGRFRHDEPPKKILKDNDYDLPKVDAVEIRVNGHPLVYLSGEQVAVPFCDIRGTIRGTYRPDTKGPERPYRTGTDPLLPGSPVDVPRVLPDAIPYDTVVSTLDHLPGLDLLISRSRACIPGLGIFTSFDPALDGVDWFQFAGGDPVNFQDRTGRYVVPIGSNHLQQDSAWADKRLGLQGKETIGNAGCTLAALSNAINQVSKRCTSDPGRLNRVLSDGYYVDNNLIAVASTERIIREATGHETVLVSVDPQEVDIDQVISAIADDPSTRYIITARIETGTFDKKNKWIKYDHSLNVTGFDSDNNAVLHDTSSRGRVSIGENERVTRYDIYAVSSCRVY